VGTALKKARSRSVQKRPIGHVLTRLGEWAAHPAAFGLALLYAVCWLIFDRESLNWHGATELIVLCMTLFIVRSEHREFQALHAKLDQVLRLQGDDRQEIIKIDHREPEDIEKHRARAQTTADDG
jgi:low affinity Fe/Cu permease